MKRYIIQPAEYVDNLSNDGHEGVKLPWHFTVTEDGDILGGNDKFKWGGTRVYAIGFSKSLVNRNIDLTWAEAIKDIEKTVGMYFVTENAHGGMGIEDTAVMSASVEEVK